MTEANSGNATYNSTDGSASEEVALHQKTTDWTDNNKEAKIGNQVAKNNFNIAEGNTKATVKIAKDGTLTITMGVSSFLKKGLEIILIISSLLF
ncbi:hypothetical protein MOZ60_06585 [Stecheria sp. CLA-KB-P133]|uniref:Uncharacterized protein n=1 Tax=Grylomicrobium aquisgranensis TaxID=2926318 RepID=A0AB35U8L1_9FIRM|nr:hypothetical protein [Stecheria sp. CLA-KB-P133]